MFLNNFYNYLLVSSTPRLKRKKVNIDAVKNLSSAETDLEFGHLRKSKTGARKFSSKTFAECFYKSDSDWTKSSFSSRSCHYDRHTNWTKSSCSSRSRYYNRDTDWTKSSFSSRFSHDSSRNCRHRNSSTSSSDNTCQSYIDKRRSPVTDFSSDIDDSRCKRRRTLHDNSSSDSFEKRSGRTKIQQSSTSLQLSGSEVLCDEYKRTKLWIKENFQRVLTKDKKQMNSRCDSSFKSDKRAKMGDSRRDNTRERTKSSWSVLSESGSSITSSSTSSSDSETTASSQCSRYSSSFPSSAEENRPMKRRKATGRTPQRRRTRSSSYSSAVTLSTSEAFFSDTSSERTFKTWKTARKEKISAPSPQTENVKLKLPSAASKEKYLLLIKQYQK